MAKSFQRLKLPGAARLQMIGVCKSSSNLVAVSIIQNILNLDVALFLIRVIGQRARDLIGKLVGRVLNLIGNGVRFLRFFLLFGLLRYLGRFSRIARRRIGRIATHRAHSADDNQHHDDAQNGCLPIRSLAGSVLT